MLSSFFFIRRAKGESWSERSPKRGMGHSQQTSSSPCLQQNGPKGASQLSHCPSTESNESKHIATIAPTRMNYENVNKYFYALLHQQYAIMGTKCISKQWTFCAILTLVAIIVWKGICSKMIWNSCSYFGEHLILKTSMTIMKTNKFTNIEMYDH